MKKIWKKAVVLAATIALSCGAMSISSYAGWQQNETGWWYQNDDNSYVQNGWKQINGKWYLFNADGYMLTGWQNVGGTWYYMNGSGAMTTDWQNINGKWYYMKESGAMRTGWRSIRGNWYYMEDSGAMVTSWLFLNGKQYFLDESGAMLTGQHVIDGVSYNFNSDGSYQEDYYLWYLYGYMLYDEGVCGEEYCAAEETAEQLIREYPYVSQKELLGKMADQYVNERPAKCALESIKADWAARAARAAKDLCPYGKDNPAAIREWLLGRGFYADTVEEAMGMITR